MMASAAAAILIIAAAGVVLAGDVGRAAPAGGHRRVGAPPPLATAAAPVVRVGSGAVSASLVWERRLAGVTIRESSPLAVSLPRPAVVVGGQDGRLYAVDLRTGGNLPGWPVRTPYPFNGSPAAADIAGTGTAQVFIGAGSADHGYCSGGAVYSFDAGGAKRWSDQGSDPSCAHQAFHSTPAIGDITGTGVADVTLGALGLQSWSFAGVNGTVNPGWPYYTDDTVFSSPALADVNGDGVADVIMGGDSSPGGLIDLRGGVVRAVSGTGRTLWQFFTNEIVRSSPAVGIIDRSGQPSVVFGTGDYWVSHGGASDADKVYALDLHGQLRWSRDLGGITMASPALADVTGTGEADVVIGTAGGPHARGGRNAGTIWVLDGGGRPLPHWAGRPSPGGVVIGGITTADLNGDGAQDLLVPTGAGVFAFDGRSGRQLFALDEGAVSFQDSPLVTDDGGGIVGITVAGTRPDGTGIIQHWQMDPASGARLGALGWPTFHHDARRTGNQAPPPLTAQRCAAAGDGYWTAAGDGGVFSFCGTAFHGSATGVIGRAPVASLVSTGDGRGYWLATTDGGVFAFGSAPFLGSAATLGRHGPVVAMARTPSGQGYWLLTADGGVYAFGDAPFEGSLGGRRQPYPVVSMTVTPSGRGYWLANSAGAVFCFGDAGFFGTAQGVTRSAIVAIARTPQGEGYWLAAADGGVFTYGDAKYLGSAAALHLNAGVVGLLPTAAGRGYWLAGADGGVFSFGDARPVTTSRPGALVKPVVAIAASSG